MRRIPVLAFGILCLVAEIGSSRAVAAPPEDLWSSRLLRNGDRVAFVGGTFVEREQRYGYLETVLTIANPDSSIVFRNLGWSGDTIGGVSRSGFDPPEAGFKQLVDQVNAVKPTVIVLGYGANEAFAGKAGLDAFVKGYERMIDALAPTKARFVLLAPLKQEKLAAPLPDPTKHNQDIAVYSKAIEELAKRRGIQFVTLDPFTDPDRSSASDHLTDNGLHLTALGYWSLAKCFELKNQDKMTFSMKVTKPGGHPPSPVECTLNWPGANFMGTVSEVVTNPREVRFTRRDRRLPFPPRPAAASAHEKSVESPPRSMQVKGLEPGRYTLKIDGKPIATASDSDWMSGPETDQVEHLRQAIIRKNELFFHRWRPQNITYLFGFRKHEQGNNAVEIPRFDPLVAEMEQKIAVLKKPAAHVYELVRDKAKEGGR